jgi:hypothetical protein
MQGSAKNDETRHNGRVPPIQPSGGFMIISLVNRSASISDEDMQRVVRAINRQITEDFTPYWSFGATVRLEGAVGARMNKQSLPDMRGDAVMYVLDGLNKQQAEGWHDKNFRDIPCGYVYLGMCDKMNDPWTMALSHEILELIGDPMSNLWVQGPHPTSRKKVLHMFEMCDAVQCEFYEIEGIVLSNFVLPSYFSPGTQEGRRNDFLNRAYKGKTLKSFGINPGGYLNVMHPKTGKWENPTRAADPLAESRLKAKAAAQIGRGFMRRNS